MRVRALTIACTDPDRTSRFYEQVLGAKRVPTDVGDHFQLGSLGIALVANASERSPATFPTHAMPILWLEVSDLAEAAAHFARHDVPIVDEGDGQFMMIEDPDGLVIEIWQADET